MRRAKGRQRLLTSEFRGHSDDAKTCLQASRERLTRELQREYAAALVLALTLGLQDRQMKGRSCDIGLERARCFKIHDGCARGKYNEWWRTW